MRKLLLVVALAASFAAVSATGASADYGQGAQYQIELSANLNSVQGGGIGGGVWLWIQLDQNGGSYTGSDCGHMTGNNGAAADSGTLTSSDWFYSNADGNSNPSGNYVTITGITLNGLGGYPATVTVPKTYGHYTGSIGSFISLPFPTQITSAGFSQVQVAQ